MSDTFYGIGYNSKRKHKTKLNGKPTEAYKTWYSMLQRCYCPKRLKRNPSYIGCSVSREWHDFQDFADWYESHDYSYDDYQLDKDILHSDNKVYSPEACCFVPRSLNMLLATKHVQEGGTPQGVSFTKQTGRYRSVMNIDGVELHLGYYDCPHEAHLVYKKAKEVHIKNKAREWRDRISSDVFNALMSWKLET